MLLHSTNRTGLAENGDDFKNGGSYDEALGFVFALPKCIQNLLSTPVLHSTKIDKTSNTNVNKRT